LRSASWVAAIATPLVELPVRIFPLTGPSGVFGQQNVQGLEIAADLVNDRGGVKGQKIVIVKGDASSTAAAISETNRLIANEGAKILTGSSTSGVAMAATQEAERNGALYWEGMGVANGITERGFKGLFRVGLNASGLGLPSIQYALGQLSPRLGIDAKRLKIAIVAEDSGFGVDISNEVEKFAKANGSTVVLKENYSARTTDLSSIVLKMRSLQPDVVIATQFINDAILLQRQMKELQFVPKAFIGTGAGHATLSLPEALGGDVNGLMSASYPADINESGLSPKARADLAEFKKRFVAKHGKQPAVQESLGFVVGISLFEDVMAKARSLEPADLMAAARAADVPPGTYINGWGMKFDEKGQNTRAFGVVVQWQDRTMKVVHPAALKTHDPVLLPLPAWNRR
jgi:branched-chain amino acid transport system substrate-binding protein